MLLEPGGKASFPATVASKGAEDSVKTFNEVLKAGREAAQDYTQAAPRLIKVLELMPNATMGAGGDIINQARKWAVRMGLTKDEAGNITSTETMLKTMLGSATAAARAFNSRATQMEFVQFLKAFAATAETDKRSAANIVTQMLLDGMNENVEHEARIKEYKGVPGLENAEKYRVPNFPTMDKLARDMARTGLITGIKQDPRSGLFSDTMAANRGTDAYLPKPGPGAIEKLKADPKLRERFEERYGLGSSHEHIGMPEGFAGPGE